MASGEVNGLSIELHLNTSEHQYDCDGANVGFNVSKNIINLLNKQEIFCSKFEVARLGKTHNLTEDHNTTAHKYCCALVVVRAPREGWG